MDEDSPAGSGIWTVLYLTTKQCSLDLPTRIDSARDKLSIAIPWESHDKLKTAKQAHPWYRE